MVEVHLYGNLRRYAQNGDSSRGSVLRMEPRADETVDTLLTRMEIPLDKIHHIFLNAKLLVTRSGMAKWLRYQQVRTDPFDWNLATPLKPGDRIGLFGRDMAALVV